MLQPAAGIDKKIIRGKVLRKIILNAKKSEKDIYHIEIKAYNSFYSPGDALGIIPHNPNYVVNKILKIVDIPLSIMIDTQLGKEKLVDLLTRKRNILYLSKRVVKKYASIIKQDLPLIRRDLLEILNIHPIKKKADFIEIVKNLDLIKPRLYSISSASKVHLNKLHLTVAKNSFYLNGEMRYGLCSNQLSNLIKGEEIDFYIQKNNFFKLPSLSKDIILIGAGTGIAPFRSFLAEREAVNATGKNWLFYGAHRSDTNFLYNTEINDWVDKGILNKVNLAFSRDQKEKIYVQNKIWENRNELLKWITNGAYVYICGAKKMSVDVDNTFLQIRNKDYLKILKEEGRYIKSVY